MSRFAAFAEHELAALSAIFQFAGDIGEPLGDLEEALYSELRAHMRNSPAPSADPASPEALMRKLEMDFNQVHTDFASLKVALTDRLQSDAAKIESANTKIADLSAKLASASPNSDEAEKLHQEIVELTQQVTATASNTASGASDIPAPKSSAVDLGPAAQTAAPSFSAPPAQTTPDSPSPSPVASPAGGAVPAPGTPTSPAPDPTPPAGGQPNVPPGTQAPTGPAADPASTASEDTVRPETETNSDPSTLRRI